MLRSTRLPITTRLPVKCLLAALAIGAGLACSAAAVAQDAPPPGAYDHRGGDDGRDDGPPPGVHGDRDDGPPPGAHGDRDDEPNVRAGPPVGYDSAYDYGVANDPASDSDPYYQYRGPPPTDPRAREQRGLRYGALPIEPRTPYYAGVSLDYGYGGYGYGYGYGGYAGCGCAHYRRRYDVYYDDFGQRGASYRGYDDHHRREDYGRGYGDQ